MFYMCRNMSSRPVPAGRGGRGAALLQMLNQQVRTPGDPGASAPSSQQQQTGGVVGGAVTAVPQQLGSVLVAGPAPPGAQGMAPSQAPSRMPVNPVSGQPTAMAGPPYVPATAGGAVPQQPGGTVVGARSMVDSNMPVHPVRGQPTAMAEPPLVPATGLVGQGQAAVARGRGAKLQQMQQAYQQQQQMASSSATPSEETGLSIILLDHSVSCT